MTSEITLQRPEPIPLDTAFTPFHRDSNIPKTIEALEKGIFIGISTYYSHGLKLHKAIHTYLSKLLPNKTFKEQRAYRAAYRKLTQGILVEVKNHKLTVKKAPFIGWFIKLYPETANCLLTFSQVQGLNSAWQWYEKGIHIPVLRNKIHPYYGVYFPTRFEHLLVFDQWLKRYKGPKKEAFDIGFGSGVLSFQLVKYGFQKVYGTDTNPNAIVGIKEFMGNSKLSRKIEVNYGSLFGSYSHQSELIVFNPPWLPTHSETNNLDEAIYYPEDLFPDFFAAAKEHLLPHGKLVLLFSNLAQITAITQNHPIEQELTTSGRFKLEDCYEKTVKDASQHTQRDLKRRAAEKVQLWVLVHR